MKSVSDRPSWSRRAKVHPRGSPVGGLPAKPYHDRPELQPARCLRGDEAPWSRQPATYLRHTGAMGVAGLDMVPLAKDDFGAWRQQVVARLADQRQLAGTHTQESAQVTAAGIVDRLLIDGVSSPHQHVFVVLDAGRRVGSCWLAVTPDNGEAFVYDVAAQPAYTEGVMEALEHTATELGADVLRLNVFGHEAELAMTTQRRDYKVSATQMRLPLRPALTRHSRYEIAFRQMDESEFDRFRSSTIAAHAENLIRSRTAPPSQAARNSAKEFDDMLPDGLATQGSYLWCALSDRTPVGTLWIEVDQHSAFICDVAVEASLRRRGYGTAIMHACERFCLAEGITVIGLSVFGFNVAARAMYQKLGYELVEELRYKELPAGLPNEATRVS